ncbi:MAG: hypothetical protein ACKO37_01730 [Vampirovibrionales bacterium]
MMIPTTLTLLTPHTQATQAVAQAITNHPQGFLLYVSHSSLLHSVGGTEKVMLHDMAQARQCGYITVHVYSERVRHQWGGYRYHLLIQGLRSGDYELSSLSFTELKHFLKPLCHQTAYQGLLWHHSLHWHRTALHQVLQWGEARVRRVGYLHDFYTACPSVNLRRMDKGYCGRLESETPDNYLACQTCEHPKRHRTTIAQWQEAFMPLWHTMHHIIAPSHFMQQAYESLLDDSQKKWFRSTCLVKPHGRFYYHDAKDGLTVQPPQQPILPMGIVFIGATHPIKGWDGFKHLASDVSLLGRYTFYHVGTHTDPHPNITWIPYHHSQEEDPEQPSLKQLLADTPIHLAYLGSRVPETYSFVLQEAKSLGLPILTHPESGNIAHSMMPHDASGAAQEPTFGKVFDSVTTLSTWLKDTLGVHVWLNTNPYRRGGTFHPYSYTAESYAKQQLCETSSTQPTERYVIMSTYHPENHLPTDIAQGLACYHRLGYKVYVVDTSPCDADLHQQGKALKQQFADEYGLSWVWRDNTGYDFTSYQHGLHQIRQLIDHGNAIAPAQVILTNDSCIHHGEALEQLLTDELPTLCKHYDYDVLGFTESWEGASLTPHEASPHIQYHLQSYWLCIRPSAWETLCTFFDTLANIHTRQEAIVYGELALSASLQRAGCRLGAVWSFPRILKAYESPSGLLALCQGTRRIRHVFLKSFLYRQGTFLSKAWHRVNPSLVLAEGYPTQGFTQLASVKPLWAFTKRKAVSR